jgi:transcriptional antiterminator RfaH
MNCLLGHRWPTIPDCVIEDFRAALGGGPVRVIPERLQLGETVQIAGGVFHGLRAVVARVMPGRERVAVLLEFLGRQTMAEIASSFLVRSEDQRRRIL